MSNAPADPSSSASADSRLAGDTPRDSPPDPAPPELGNAQAGRVIEAFRRRFRRSPEILVRAPARVALLGAHIDYSDGWVIPAAIEPAIWLAAAPLSGRQAEDGSRLLALDFDAEMHLRPAHLPPPVGQRQPAVAHWQDLPRGMAWALAEQGWTPSAAEMVYGGDVPVGAGVSSSAAVEMALFLAWREMAQEGPLGMADAQRGVILGRRAENAYLGVQSGFMDPFASLFGRAGHLLFLDCRSLELELLRWPRPVCVLVFDSGVRRRLSESGFNDRREECRRAVALLETALPGIRALRDVSLQQLDTWAYLLPPVLERRARHAVEECARVRQAASDLRQGDVEAFGAAMAASHASSRDRYEVSLPELDLLAEVASNQPGCWGAKLMGGGFGGCVAALVKPGRVADVEEAVARAFESSFGRRPEAFSSSLADGASLRRL